MALEEARKLEVYFIPCLSPSHTISLVDMARLFAMRGVKTTIITIPTNALLFQRAIDQDIESGYQIVLHLLKYPLETPLDPYFLRQQPVEQLIRECRPDCIVSDMFYPWTADVATQLGIPRILFYGTGFLSLSAEECVACYMPHKNVLSDTEPFLLPGLPDLIEMTRSQLPDQFKLQNEFIDLIQLIRESVPKSYGVLVHSFYELEQAYVEHYRKNVKEKVWHVGPLVLCNKDDAKVKAERGSKACNDGVTDDNNNCLGWLDSQKPNSVLYICFGSLTCFTNAQLFEIATSLEASGHPFIWVVKKDENSSAAKDWLPEGFEKRMVENQKGMIIRGWAPQLLILEKPAIGGFLTHTGWNSVLESVTASVPMITWPLYADQFYNEKLVVEVLKIGIPVGVEGPNTLEEEGKTLVKREKIENAVAQLMDGGDNAEEIRKRVRELGKAAKRATEDGGSSYTSLTALIQEISLIKVL